MRKDRDAVPFDFDWPKAVLVAPPKKRTIAIRIDADVVAFFRRGGTGHPERINAVLRNFVAEQKKKK